MTPKNKTRHSIQKGHLVFPIVLLIVCMIAIAVNLTKVFQKSAPPSSLTPIPTPLPHTTYSSDKLGISFAYIPLFPNGIGQYFFTKELGDKVYLYWVPGANQPFSGSDTEFLQTIAPSSKYVEVFNKDPQQSLTDTIKQQFLTGYAESDCFVHTTHYGHSREDESFQTAIIDYPRHSTQTRAQLGASIAKCPKYVTANGVSYFMLDPQHPNKLLFIKLGQDNLPSGVKGYSWDETIKVLQ